MDSGLRLDLRINKLLFSHDEPFSSTAPSPMLLSYSGFYHLFPACLLHLPASYSHSRWREKVCISRESWKHSSNCRSCCPARRLPAGSGNFFESQPVALHTDILRGSSPIHLLQPHFEKSSIFSNRSAYAALYNSYLRPPPDTGWEGRSLAAYEGRIQSALWHLQNDDSLRWVAIIIFYFILPIRSDLIGLFILLEN
ncbi:unnamed protein product [Protopolystoma xenopodis]|uniref:Uncharacterized protein n=1 Tax=Protopolystoma xenopodis TaxID=117903 RepID=A0A448WFL7_9PLAT|nr:unnamed protein product [Protopolystoma xenopodis]